MAQMASNSVDDLELNGLSRLTELLSSSEVLNPQYFLDYLASVIKQFVGIDQSLYIPAETSNKDMNSGESHHVNRLEFLIANLDTGKHNPLIFPFPIGCIRDQRLLTADKCAPYLLDDKCRWYIDESVKIIPPHNEECEHAKATLKITNAVLLGNNLGRICVYATIGGLFYNDPKTGIAQKIIDGSIGCVWKQVDSIYAADIEHKLYGIVLPKDSLTPMVIDIFDPPTQTGKQSTTRPNSIQAIRRRQLSAIQTFIGSYFDAGRQRLIIADSDGIKCIGVGKGNDKLLKLLTQFEKKMAADQMKDKCRYFYYDIELETITVIGTKYLVRIPIDDNHIAAISKSKEIGKFGRVFEMKELFPNTKAAVSQYLYSYELRSLFIMSKMTGSARVPWKLDIYSGESLKFDRS